MQIIHRISFNSSPAIRKELAGMGIVVGASGLVSIDLDESHDSWPRMQHWIAARRAVDLARTKFSNQEIADARWLELVPSWHRGYPQPDEGHGYREVSYDLSAFCPKCCVARDQKAAFRMKTEPKWGRNGILQLNRIFDEYFVTPRVWAKVFEPYGVGCRQVQNTKGTELKTVVQLVAPQEVDIVTRDLRFEKCPKCGRLKYLPVTRGPSPALIVEPTGHIAKTRQYFGSGFQADKRVLISKDLANALTREKVRGASVRPVAEQSTVDTMIV